mgnify:CR=1 FL=1
MKNKKIIYTVSTLLITSLCVTGCSAKLTNGNKNVVKILFLVSLFVSYKKNHTFAIV